MAKFCAVLFWFIQVREYKGIRIKLKEIGYESIQAE